VDELALAAVHGEIPGVPLGEAAPDAEHQVGFQEELVATPGVSLEADPAAVEGMVEGDAALGHVRRDDWDLQILRQFDERLAGPGQHHAAAHHQNGAISL
jgi:hypothetical protein